MSQQVEHRRLVVRGAEIRTDDTRLVHRRELARITLDAMAQFVGLLDARGTVLEINQVALDAVGVHLADVEGKPLWTTFWWQVSEEVNATLRESIARAAKGEFVRWDTTIYGRAGGKETIALDASLTPVFDDQGEVVFLCAEGRDITEKKARERELAEKSVELLGLLARVRELDEIETQRFADVGHELRAPLTRALAPAQRLAVDDADRAPDVAAAPREAAGVDRPRVLVVEDNLDMNRFVTQCLGAHYEVSSAFDGREGLAMAERIRPTLVVTDIVMPGVSGVEMIAAMRASPALRDTPVLVLSAKADEALLVKLLDDGAQDFVVKPFSVRELVVRVRGLVNLAEARAVSALALAREHEAHAQVEVQKRRLHALFMQAPTLIAVLRGPAHVVELANPPICDAWGRAESDVLERPLLEAMPELRDQAFPALLDAVFTTGITHAGRETAARLGRDPGSTTTAYFNYVYSAFRDASGAVEGVFVIASDVTPQVLARDEVDGLRAAAESASRAKDEFFAMLGHELRNPLSPIQTALQVMRLRGEPGSARERTVIERQVTHLTRLVDDLLDVSRIARGRVELKTEPIEVSDVVAKAIEMASPLLEQRAHALTVEVPREGLRVEADATRLAQVVSNLLTNAAKYTPPGGAVAVRASRVGDDAVLSVRDTGIGITPEMLPRIFDLFVQERQALDRSQGGLGIGLTIVRSLVERHGGAVSAHSDGPGQGTEFVVRLPLTARGGAFDVTAGVAPRRSAGAGVARILVVDDNEDGAEMLAAALTERGYETRIAHDAPAALRVAASFAPDTALLDIGLPVMDGYELAAHLRALPGLAAIRLVAVTGYGQESDRQRARDAGFDHHFVKPVDLDALDAVLSPRDA